MPQGTFQCPVPVISPLHRRPSNTNSWFGSVSFGVTASILWDFVNEKICFLPPRLESQCPPVFWKSYNQILLTFKARFPLHSLSLCQIPRITWGSEPSQQCTNFFGIIVSSLWVIHLVGIEFYFIVIAPFLQSHCHFFFFFVFGCGISFFWWVPASSCQWLFNS